jgi:hypothetical protein
MKPILLLLVGIQILVGSARADTALITLDNGFTWKAVFDAGFRPIHIGDGTYGCRQMNVHVKIRKQEGGEILDLGLGDIEFSLRDGHLLDLVSFFGREFRAVDEVEEKSDVFSRIFGSAVRQRAQIAWFEVEHTVDYSGRKIDPPEITRQVDDKNAVNGAKIGDLSIVYSFRSANSREKPMVERLSIAFRSSEAMKGRPLKTKIEPPAGYEHVSLEPALAETALSPTATPDQPTRTLSSPTVGPAKSTPSPNQPTAEKATDESPSNLPWVWIIGAILLLAVAGGALIMLRRK